MRRTARFSLLFAAIAGPACAATQERIGSWVLSCTEERPGFSSCVMRLDQHLFGKAGITADLEVKGQGALLVPVLTLRGLSAEVLMATAMAGKVQASLQFPGGRPADLTCAVSDSGYLCAPDEATGRTLATGLAKARSVTVRGAVLIEGMKPLPVPDTTLALAGTQAALARLRAVGVPPVAHPVAVLTSHPPDGLKQMADTLLKAAGYPNGVADLQALLAKYRGK